MPRSAIATGSVDQVLRLEAIGPALVALVTGRTAVAPLSENREVRRGNDQAGA
jgi:hypothetical protein